MASNQDYIVACGTNKKNTGLSKLCPDIGTIVGYILVPKTFSIATAVEAATITPWQDLIQANKAERGYPFPPVFMMEDESEDAVFQEGSVSSIFVRDGKIQMNFIHESSRYKHESLKSHTLGNYGIVLFDQQGRIQGVQDDNGVFQPGILSLFVVQKLKSNDGTEGTTSKVTAILQDSDKWQKSPAVITPDFDVKELEGLFDVFLDVAENTTPTTSEVIINASIGNTDEGVLGFSDVVGEDWTVKDVSNAEQSITTITDNSDGTYTFAFGTPLSAGTYTFNLLVPNVMVTLGFESLGAVTVVLV